MERHSHPSFVITLSSDYIEARASNEFGGFVANLNLIAIRQRTTRILTAVWQNLDCAARQLLSKAWAFLLKCLRDALKTVVTVFFILTFVLLAFPFLDWLNTHVLLTLFGIYLTQDQVQLIVDKLIDIAL